MSKGRTSDLSSELCVDNDTGEEGKDKCEDLAYSKEATSRNREEDSRAIPKREASKVPGRRTRNANQASQNIGRARRHGDQRQEMIS